MKTHSSGFTKTASLNTFKAFLKKKNILEYLIQGKHGVVGLTNFYNIKKGDRRNDRYVCVYKFKYRENDGYGTNVNSMITCMTI